jgi:hypothetical protein
VITPEDEKTFREMWEGDDLFVAGHHGMISIDPEYKALLEEIIPTLSDNVKITLIPPVEYALFGYEENQLHYTWQA